MLAYNLVVHRQMSREISPRPGEVSGKPGPHRIGNRHHDDRDAPVAGFAASDACVTAATTTSTFRRTNSAEVPATDRTCRRPMVFYRDVLPLDVSKVTQALEEWLRGMRTGRLALAQWDSRAAQFLLAVALGRDRQAPKQKETRNRSENQFFLHWSLQEECEIFHWRAGPLFQPSPVEKLCRNCHFESEARNLFFGCGLEMQDLSLRSRLHD